MIEVSHVSRRFGDFLAVDDISFSIPTGQIVGLLGPNGAGKTTTMRMICGYLGASSGSIKIDGAETSANPVAAKRKIGYMPESAPLYSDMIVHDYLMYIAKMHGTLKNTVSRDEKIAVLCKTCGLQDVMHKNIGELSRGYRQRVGLAHALMNDPEILVLDEPTSGLDPNQIEDVRALIKEIGKTRTVIISTHILGEVEMLCPRVIIISKGRLVADSPTNALRDGLAMPADAGEEGASVPAFSAPTLALTLGGATFSQVKAALEQIQGVASVACVSQVTGAAQAAGSEQLPELHNIQGEDILCELTLSMRKESRKDIFNMAVKNGWTIYQMNIQKNSLEDVFHALTLGK